MITTIYCVEYCKKSGRYIAIIRYSDNPNSDLFVVNGIGFLTFGQALKKAHSLNKEFDIV